MAFPPGRFSQLSKLAAATTIPVTNAAKQENSKISFKNSHHCGLHDVVVLVLSEASAACASGATTRLAALRRRSTFLIDIVIPQIGSRRAGPPRSFSCVGERRPRARCEQ
jgi:hypothetical protein